MKFFREWLNFFLLLFMLALLLFFLFWPFVIIGNSMQNTFQDHDRIFASRFLVCFNLKRGDVIICRHNNKNIIKRIIALPGEKIVIRNNFVSVNDKILYEPYVINYTQADIELILNSDEYFIIGDNRILSRDSRFFMPVKKSDIIAKVLFKFFPSFSFVNYNWEDNL